ncbi:unnamed protein product [Linum trigynum]|uniref:Uncharacterized protein n=1 Tax=Linum trigynum TaxID=586398 RepID=A0AAV2DHD8_9ROSI
MNNFGKNSTNSTITGIHMVDFVNNDLRIALKSYIRDTSIQAPHDSFPEYQHLYYHGIIDDRKLKPSSH